MVCHSHTLITWASGGPYNASDQSMTDYLIAGHYRVHGMGQGPGGILLISYMKLLPLLSHKRSHFFLPKYKHLVPVE